MGATGDKGDNEDRGVKGVMGKRKLMGDRES